MTDVKPALETTWVVDLPSLRATEDFAKAIARELRPGAIVTLTGDLGAGKTAFARALIRVLTGNPDLEVPSPTFTLMQVYDGLDCRIVHSDLYRIGSPDEIAELGWEETADKAILLIEWADRAGDVLGGDRLDIGFILEPEEGPEYRVAVVTGMGSWAPRVQVMRAIEKLLKSADWQDTERQFMLGDASVRAYERLARGREKAILMISPPRPDGPAIRYGKPYSAIARLAETVRPFVALAEGLRSEGFSAPEIKAMDLKTGLLLIEDFGQETVLIDGKPDPERYAEAVALLANLHQRQLPDKLPITGEEDYRIPPYDLDAQLIEVELMLDWYLPHRGRPGLSATARNQFLAIWKGLLTEVAQGQKTWVLRDYHSPNLMWMPDREGINRVGIIDFQDAVIGHPAYDVVSLTQDARVDLPQGLELQLLGHYAKLRQRENAAFNLPAFARDYAIMGTQRNTKILGIFARLSQRDGKPGYLKHLPRIEAYTRQSLSHPVLSELKAWYVANVPGLFEPDAA